MPPPTPGPLGEEAGLKAPSGANLYALQSVSKQRLGKYLGSVPARCKLEIRRALLFALELDDG
ncbi:MAG TPA: hypothetical protein VGJ84_09280 [Polyangiaceae bacterium]